MVVLFRRLILASVYLICLPCLAADEMRKETKPHIVVVVADDLGWKDVGFHGGEIETPALDRLATSGVRLERFYVMPVCSPTRAALMTGRYPMRLGLQKGVIRPWADYGLPLDERTLPQILKEAGYRTALTGKWHLGSCAAEYLPLARGFDHAYGQYLGMIDYYTHDRFGGLDWHRNGKPLREEGYTTKLIAQEAVGLIKDHDNSQPLFLYVAFNAPHTPLQAPEEYLDRYRQIADTDRRTYAAMVSCMDDAIASIVAALKKQGLWENTLFLFFSDNGGPTRNGANNDPLRGAKGSLYEGGIRVPAFVTWPQHLQGGRQVTAPLHVVDVLPTITKLVGASLEGTKPLDGLDVREVVAEGKPVARDEILFNINSVDGAVRRGDWKLLVHFAREGKPERTEFFNIAEDPCEKMDLAGANPEKVRQLRERLDSYASQAALERDGHIPQPKDFVAPEVWGDL